MGVFPRDSSPYLREFRRKPLKTLNGKVDKRDRGLNLHMQSTSFERYRSATGGAYFSGEGVVLEKKVPRHGREHFDFCFPETIMRNRALKPTDSVPFILIFFLCWHSQHMLVLGVMSKSLGP